MIILENIYMEITSRQYINSVIKEEQTIWVHRPLAICEGIFCSNQITRKSQKDVSMQDVQIYDYSCMKRREKEDYSLYEGCKLFLSEDRLEVVGVDYGIASIPPFRIDVLLSSKNIQFSVKITRAKSNDNVELRKILKSPCLPPDQYLGSRKILKVFMIHNNVDRIGQIF